MVTVWPGDLLFEVYIVYQMGDVFIVFYCLFCVLLLGIHKARLKVGPSKMMKNHDIRVPRKSGGKKQV